MCVYIYIYKYIYIYTHMGPLGSGLCTAVRRLTSLEAVDRLDGRHKSPKWWVATLRARYNGSTREKGES